MLTTDELKAIQAADPSPTVKRLLWDIFRLRIVARRAAQISDHIGDPKRQSRPLDALLIGLNEEVAQLPFLEEDRQRRHRMLYGHGETKKPKGIDNH